MSLNEFDRWIDPLRATQPSLSKFLGRHQWIDDRREGLAEVARRYERGASIRFVWYNTYLLRGVLGIGDKPDINARARELGAVVRANYDVAALCEIFEPQDARTVFNAWLDPRWVPPEHRRYGRERTRRPVDYSNYPRVRNAMGRRGPGVSALGSHPDPLADFAASDSEESDDLQTGGCLTIVQRPAEISEAQWYRYEAEYTESVFSGTVDSYAAKGVLRCVVTIGGVSFVLYSTHLQAGGNGARGARRNQLIELVQFIGATKTAELPTILVGDFNEEPADALLSGTLLPGLDQIGGGFRDVWAWRQNDSWGPTVDFKSDPRICSRHSERPEWCFDAAPRETSFTSGRGGGRTVTRRVNGRRIDLVFLERAAPEHRFVIDVCQPRRIPFYRDHVGYALWTEAFKEIPPALSDHLGVALELNVAPVA